MRSTANRLHLLGVCLAVGASVATCRAELVVNGGFETGGFFPWLVPPNVPLGQPNPQYFDINNNGAHGGTYYAAMSSTQLRFMSQILPTTAGADYELSFWVRRTGLGPGVFRVRWEGQVVYDPFMSNLDFMEWKRHTVLLHSNITGSLLEFGQSYFPQEYHIDDISVVQIPSPSAAAVLLMGASWRCDGGGGEAGNTWRNARAA